MRRLAVLGSTGSIGRQALAVAASAPERVRIVPNGDGCRLHARSQSRVGRGDFGQNRRNLRELFAALDVGAAG